MGFLVGVVALIFEKEHLENTVVIFGSNCFSEAFKSMDLSAFSALFLISQQSIWDLHGSKITQALGATPFRSYMVSDGEATKSLDSYSKLLSWLADEKADRKSLLLVLGGGVVGDLSGFVASTYMRGMEWLYIPNTLLAQQDASIGGKVAVNLRQGKNLVGQFWNPKAVLIDSSVLATLPQRQINAGYMEFLKHGLLSSVDLYQRILQFPRHTVDWADQLPLLAEGLKVKMRIVKEDPYEKDQRRLLNLGHTFAHALESYTQYRHYLHGEAVGIGLVFAALLANRLGHVYDWSALVEAVKPRVPLRGISEWSMSGLLDLTRLDKKGVGGEIPWIIPEAPGQVYIRSGLPRTLIEDTFQNLLRALAPS